jgi:hypothetical protein
MRALVFLLSFMLASATVSYAASREAEQRDAPQAKSGDEVEVEAAEDGIVKGSEITPTQAEGSGGCRLSASGSRPRLASPSGSTRRAKPPA